MPIRVKDLRISRVRTAFFDNIDLDVLESLTVYSLKHDEAGLPGLVPDGTGLSGQVRLLGSRKLKSLAIDHSFAQNDQIRSDILQALSTSSLVDLTFDSRWAPKLAVEFVASLPPTIKNVEIIGHSLGTSVIAELSKIMCNLHSLRIRYMPFYREDINRIASGLKQPNCQLKLFEHTIGWFTGRLRRALIENKSLLHFTHTYYNKEDAGFVKRIMKRNAALQ